MRHTITSRSQGRYALSGAQPDWIEPMRAVAAGPLRDAGTWVWEPQLAGARCLAFAAHGRVTLRSARGYSFDAVLPQLATALGTAVRGDAILDGVYHAGVYHVFDCLHYEGVSLCPLPLVDRKAVLRDAVWFNAAIRFTPFRSAGSDATCQSPAAAGVIVKRADGPYVGGPSQDWLAYSSVQAREFVIGGYVAGPPGGLPEALLIGTYSDGRLQYAGRVVATCEPDAFRAMSGLLFRLRRRTTPFGGAVPEGSRIRWTSPALVAQVGFAELSPAGLLRQPRFIGLRFDREPDEVRRPRMPPRAPAIFGP